MSPGLYLTYLLACVVITTMPGPSVMLIIANSLTHGTRAGLLNLVGTELALGLMVAILAVGLASVIASTGWWFEWLWLAGGAYVAWLGWQLMRTSGAPVETDVAAPRGGFVLQGFLVMLSNPKALLLLGAFPHFIDPQGDYLGQVALLGATVMVVAMVSGTGYSVLLGWTGLLISRRRVRMLSRVSGAILLAGGLWLAFAPAR